MAALIPCVTNETASRFDVDWGTLLKQTKIRFQERQKRISQFKQTAGKILSEYGIKLDRAINSKTFPQLFIKLPESQETKLLFGNNKVSKSNYIVRGLKQGGVYRRHQDYQNPETPIRISFFKVINDADFSILSKQIPQRLSKYKFKSIIVEKKLVKIEGLSETEAIAKVQEELKRLLDIPTDIVIVGLPTKDRKVDDDVSLYTRIYSTLLDNQKASQFFYEYTLNKTSSNNILNNVIPGILAKLGNIPFVLKDPLNIADYFIGFDVSRKSKKNNDGTINACASIRLYGKQGNFLRYHLEDSAIEGEEISKKILQNLLPGSQLKGKIVLIYRDGRFVGKEVENLIDWSKAIESKFILVESRKSQIPRLYNFQNGIQKPEKGLLMKLSERSGILITTEVSENIGLARPLRLTIHPKGHQTSIEELADATLKLTLLHHGSLKPPRLPVPLFAADEMAYRRLQGIYPTLLEGDKQFWL